MSFRRASLDLFQRQYFQLVEPEKLAWPSQDELRMPESQAWLDRYLFSSEHVQYPPPKRYQLRVLKQLIARLEAGIRDPDEDEISDDLVSRLSLLLSSKLPSEADSAQQKSYATYSYTSEDDQQPSQKKCVTLLEARSILSSSGTTGLRTWEAALHLGAFLTASSSSNFVRGKRILELGAGTGFLSILCAKHLGAAGVTATDGDPSTIEALKSNLFLNGLDDDDRVHTEVFKWGQSLLGSRMEDEMTETPYDVVLGADLTYDKKVVPLLVNSICRLIERIPSLDVIIAGTVRNQETIDFFIGSCESRDLTLQDMEFSRTPASRAQSFFYLTDTPIRIMHIKGKRWSK